MIIAGEYPFNNGKNFLSQKFPKELQTVKDVIASIDANLYKTKVSKEKTMSGTVLYSPSEMNKAIKQEFLTQGWVNRRLSCNYPMQYYVNGYTPNISKISGAFRDMDFVKNQVGVEVQFGKYAFAVYNVCAKMTIFKKREIIQCGIEIVPVKDLVDEMSSGIIYFEQLVWDLKERGVSDIDIPVLILGIAAS